MLYKAGQSAVYPEGGETICIQAITALCFTEAITTLCSTEAITALCATEPITSLYSTKAITALCSNKAITALTHLLKKTLTNTLTLVTAPPEGEIF